MFRLPGRLPLGEVQATAVFGRVPRRLLMRDLRPGVVIVFRRGPRRRHGVEEAVRAMAGANGAEDRREPHRLPVLEGGLMGELLYAEAPRIIADLQVPDDDPAAEYFAGQR